MFPSNTYAISDHSLSISTNIPTLESTINSTADESVDIQKHEITINTNNPNGAKLFISSKDNKTTPSYVTGSGLATGSGSTGISTIAEATGTLNNPTKLSPNSFGFALNKESGNIGSNNIPNTFSPSTTYESTNNKDRLAAKFVKLTPNTTPTEIYNKSGTHNNTKLSLYYGTNTNSLMREGKYELDILYTIVSNTPIGDIAENNTDTIETNPKLLPVRENQTFYKDNTITIKTNIKANKSITPADITININNKPCTDITITKNLDNNQGTTNDLTNLTYTLELTCKAPQNPSSTTGNKYNLRLTITKLNITITKQNAIEYKIVDESVTSIEYMQDFTSAMCTKMTEHQTATLKDKRDNNTYTIAKLKDGKCWMTQNLRYQLSATTPLKPQDSDVQQNWIPNRSTEFTLTDRWDQDPEGYKTVRSYYDSNNPQHGTYYTHTAATAGTTANMNNDGDEATGSICPKGWRLPKTTYNVYNSEFFHMARDYVSRYMQWDTYSDFSNGGVWRSAYHDLTSSPRNFIFSGYRSSSSSSAKVHYVGSDGWWWSSTICSSSNAYGMDMSHSYVYPRYSNYRYDGLSVRCLAR